jgi:hypothetical protein
VETAQKKNERTPLLSDRAPQVLRDECVEAGGWAFAEPGQAGRSQAWGSGYPSDPKTVTWLAANTDPVFGFGNVVRFSWAPVKNLLRDSATVADVGWSDDEDDAGVAANAAAAKGTAKLSAFFSKAPPAGAAGSAGGANKKQRLGPFRVRKLALVEDF